MDFEVHGGGSDLVFPHHENEIAQTEAARGKPLARVWMHNGMVEMGAEKMAKSVGNIRLLHGALDEFGREARGHVASSAPTTASRSAFSEDALATPGAGRRARAARVRAPARPRAPRPRRRSTPYAERFFDALADDFNTARPRAPSCSTGWPRPTAASTPASTLGPGRLREMLRRVRAGGPARGRRRRRGPGGGASACASSARRRARSATSSAPTACATSWRRSAGRCATPPSGAAARAPGVIVYGRNPVREALRGAAAGRARLGHRARRSRAWLEAGRAARGARRRSSSALCGSPDHQGICAEAEPYPYADADTLLAADDALVLCLDEVQDPHNLGAVCRVAEAAGCAGRRDPGAPRGRGHAGGVQGLRRARWSTWRSPACATWPTGWPRPRRRRVGLRRRRGGLGALRRPGLRRPRGARAGLRGTRAAAARGRRPATSSWPCRCADRVGSLNVATAAAALVYGILHLRGRDLTGLHNYPILAARRSG